MGVRGKVCASGPDTDRRAVRYEGVHLCVVPRQHPEGLRNIRVRPRASQRLLSTHQPHPRRDRRPRGRNVIRMIRQLSAKPERPTFSLDGLSRIRSIVVDGHFGRIHFLRRFRDIRPTESASGDVRSPFLAMWPKEAKTGSTRRVWIRPISTILLGPLKRVHSDFSG